MEPGANSPPPANAFMTSGALRFTVAESAACSWLNYYVASKAAGDTAGAKIAAAQIKAAPGWPAITGLTTRAAWDRPSRPSVQETQS